MRTFAGLFLTILTFSQTALAGAAGAYTMNGVIVDEPTAVWMARQSLPPGDYWIAGNGAWGVMGNEMPLGVIRAEPGLPAGVTDADGQFDPGGNWARYAPLTGWFTRPRNGCVYRGDCER